eukprot:c52640_g1_i1 orf=3-167(-)
MRLCKIIKQVHNYATQKTEGTHDNQSRDTAPRVRVNPHSKKSHILFRVESASRAH